MRCVGNSMAKEDIKNIVENEDGQEDIIPNHTKKESVLIILAVFFAVLSFVFIKNTGIKFSNLLMPITSFTSLMNQEISINYLFIILGLLFLALSLSFALLFSLVKEKRKLFLFIIPPVVGIAGIIFFGFIIGCGILLSYFIVEYFVSKDRTIFKKISINYLVNHAVGKALLVINLSIALAVMFLLINNSSYAKTEVNNIMAANMGENITVDNLRETLTTQQKNASLIFANSILDSIETAFAQEPVCRDAMVQNRKSINDQISADIDRQLVLQQDKFDKVQNMINILVKYYPYLTAITLFAILQLFNVVIVFVAKSGTLMLYGFLKKYFNFSIN
jgi:hypothetical protein